MIVLNVSGNSQHKISIFINKLLLCLQCKFRYLGIEERSNCVQFRCFRNYAFYKIVNNGTLYFTESEN